MELLSGRQDSVYVIQLLQVLSSDVHQALHFPFFEGLFLDSFLGFPNDVDEGVNDETKPHFDLTLVSSQIILPLGKHHFVDTGVGPGFPGLSLRGFPFQKSEDEFLVVYRNVAVEEFSLNVEVVITENFLQNPLKRLHFQSHFVVEIEIVHETQTLPLKGIGKITQPSQLLPQVLLLSVHIDFGLLQNAGLVLSFSLVLLEPAIVLLVSCLQNVT